MERQRVHLAGLGFREWERVTFALETLKADVLYLFEHTGPTPGDPRSAEQRKLVAAWCDARHVQHEDIKVDLWDAASVAGKIWEIMESRDGDEFRFNASTGSKPCVVGGVLASMFWPIKPYYVHVRYDKERKKGPSQYPPERVSFIPTFHLEVPRAEAIATLGLLVDAGGALDQAVLAQQLRVHRIVRPKGAEALTPQAAYSQVQAVLRALEKLRFVDRGAGTRPSEVRLTEEGAAGFRMFNRLVDKRKD